jgi:hypothetical protein
MALKPEDIEGMVDRQDQRTLPMRQRMDDDYSLYRLNEFDYGDGRESHTTNDPMVVADKVISWIVLARLVLQIPHRTQDTTEREANNNKERLGLGWLKAADDRLVARIMPKLREQLAFYTVVRGLYGGRALFMKKNDDTTFVDITPWDPRHMYWETGSDGLKWVCYRVHKTYYEIASDYGVDLQTDESEEGTDILDFYDEDNNIIVANGRFLKKPTPHGSPCVPAFLGTVGAVPRIQSLTDTDTIKDFGESIFKANRLTYETDRKIMSTMKELVRRARGSAYTIKSPGGTKTLDNNPYEGESEIPLDTQDDIRPLEMVQMAQETGAFMGLVGGEKQRGSLPHTAYGDLQFQLSGFAINTLRQGIDSVAQPRISAVESAYSQILNLLYEQYRTGKFDSTRVSGTDRGRNYFDEKITPESIKNTGEITIELVASLPQDDTTKVAMAQMLREGPVPLAHDEYIREQVLGFQDADRIEDGVKTQLAERTLPEAAIYDLMTSAVRYGRPDLAQFYYGQLMEIMYQKMQGRMGPQGAPQGAPQGPPQGVPPTNGAGPTAMPQVMPNAQMGVPPPQPTPQAGPNVPPGSPRPGARLLGPTGQPLL